MWGWGLELRVAIQNLAGVEFLVVGFLMSDDGFFAERYGAFARAGTGRIGLLYSSV